MSAEQATFMRATGEPGDADYDAAADDTEEMAAGTLMVALTGWLRCVGCGDPKPTTGGCITTPEGRKYVYGLCPSCSAASKDEAHFAPQEVQVRGRTVTLPFSELARMKGRIGARIDAELARFVADGEPAPSGPEWTGVPLAEGAQR